MLFKGCRRLADNRGYRVWRRSFFSHRFVNLLFLVQLASTESWNKGLIVREKNYLNVFIYDKWEGHYIAVFEEGEEFEPTVCEIRDGQTTKPNYLTEADLVTRMDKNGIGLSLGCG